MGKLLYADTETTGLDPYVNKLVMVQLYEDGGKPHVVDWRTAGDGHWMHLVSLERRTWVGHNFAFDWKFLRRGGVCIKSVYDTAIAEQVLTSSGKMPSLKEVVQKYCGVTLDKDGREWFYQPAPLDERPEWNEPFPPEQIEYARNDVIYLPTVVKAQTKLLREHGLWEIFKLEMRALPAIAQMELNGVYVNAVEWRKVIAEQAAEAERLGNELLESDLAQAILQARADKFDEQAQALEVWESARDTAIAESRQEWEETNGGDPHTTQFLGWGEWKKRWMADWKAANPRPLTPSKKLKEVNLRSHEQLKMGLSMLGIDLPDTAADTLKKHVDDFPVLKPLLECRNAEKLVSTYGESLLERINPVTGRIHPGFKQIGAETGRMSSSAPNWQNIPARTAVGKALRHCVVAEPGNILLVADFSNIELRIIADLSGDKEMLRRFAQGEDLHCLTARGMYNLPDTMTDEEVKEYRLPNGQKARDNAKTINFGVMYGQSSYGFARKFEVSRDEGERYIEAYIKAYPQASAYLLRRADEAVIDGYVATVLGRKRFFKVPERPGYDADYDTKREYERQIAAIRRAAMNHPIQGTSADISKLALALFHEAGTVGRLIAVVHDELVVEVAEQYAEEVAAKLKWAMELAASFVLTRVHLPAQEVKPTYCWEK